MQKQYGELAQLVERCDRTAEVRGSNPLFSIATLQYRSDSVSLSRHTFVNPGQTFPVRTQLFVVAGQSFELLA